MTCQAALSPGLEAFHRERSRSIDAFAIAERAISALLSLSGGKRGTGPIAQAIASLRKAPPSCHYSKARKAAVELALSELSDLLALRADLAHSPLQVVTIGGELVACFASTNHDSRFGSIGRLLTIHDLRRLTASVEAIAARLNSDPTATRSRTAAA